MCTVINDFMEWEAIASVSSALIALSALVFSVFSFQKQQDRADKHAKAAVKPLLSIKSQNLLDLKSIRLINYGLGPAVIRKAEFYRTPDSKSTNRIVDLFNLKIIWELFVNVPDKRSIPANGEITLVIQSIEHLIGQGISKDDGLSILKDWERQKTGILVHIEYSDIYGNEMEPLDDELN